MQRDVTNAQQQCWWTAAKPGLLPETWTWRLHHQPALQPARGVGQCPLLSQTNPTVLKYHRNHCSCSAGNMIFACVFIRMAWGLNGQTPNLCPYRTSVPWCCARSWRPYWRMREIRYTHMILQSALQQKPHSYYTEHKIQLLCPIQPGDLHP